MQTKTTDNYDYHVDACSHLSKYSWDRFRHLPTIVAVFKGEELDLKLCRIWKGHNIFLSQLG
jgi:hypothetical protein